MKKAMTSDSCPRPHTKNKKKMFLAIYHESDVVRKLDMIQSFSLR